MKNPPWLLSKRATIKLLMRKKNISPFEKLSLDLNRSSYTPGNLIWMQAVRHVIGNRMDSVDPRGLNEKEFIERTFRACVGKEEFIKISKAFHDVRDEGKTDWKTFFEYRDKVLEIGRQIGIQKESMQ